MIKSLTQRIDLMAKERQRLYIIPTSAGGLFVGVNLTLLLTGIVYANNLVLLLAFCLFAALLLTMFQTHAIMEKFEFGAVRLSDAPANGQHGVSISSPIDLVRYELHTDKGIFPASRAMPRGHYRCRYLKAYTTGERNFFYVWTYRKLDKDLRVYPAQTPSFTPTEGAQKETVAGSGEFNKHRVYAQGASSKRIDWKAFARTEQLLVKEFEEPKNSGVVIEQARLQGDKEEVLSQMAWQIEQAKRTGLSWELKGDNFYLPMGKGQAHWTSCMEALSDA